MPKDDFQITRIEAIVEKGALVVAITYGSQEKPISSLDSVSYLVALDELADLLGLKLEMYVGGAQGV